MCAVDAWVSYRASQIDPQRILSKQGFVELGFYCNYNMYTATYIMEKPFHHVQAPTTNTEPSAHWARNSTTAHTHSVPIGGARFRTAKYAETFVALTM